MFAKYGSLKGEWDLGQLWKRLRARVPAGLPMLSGMVPVGLFSLLRVDLKSRTANQAWYF